MKRKLYNRNGACRNTHASAESRLVQKPGESQLDVEELQKNVEELQKKLNEAVSDLESACASLPACVQCQYCAHYPCSDEQNDDCEEVSEWKWRGFKEGGTDEEK